MISVGFTFNCPDFSKANSNTKCIRDAGDYRSAYYSIENGDLVKNEIFNVSSIHECSLMCAEKLKDEYTHDRKNSPGCCEWTKDDKCYWSFDNTNEIYLGYDAGFSFGTEKGTRAVLCTPGSFVEVLNSNYATCFFIFAKI